MLYMQHNLLVIYQSKLVLSIHCLNETKGIREGEGIATLMISKMIFL